MISGERSEEFSLPHDSRRFINHSAPKQKVNYKLCEQYSISFFAANLFQKLLDNQKEENNEIVKKESSKNCNKIRNWIDTKKKFRRRFVRFGQGANQRFNCKKEGIQRSKKWQDEIGREICKVHSVHLSRRVKVVEKLSFNGKLSRKKCVVKWPKVKYNKKIAIQKK